MAIKTNYKLKEVVEVKDSIIRVDRLWGSSKEGWTALVGVYVKTLKDIPAVEAVVEKRLVEGSESEYEDVIITEAKEATQVEVLEKIDEFNISTPYVIDERGYVSIYNAIYNKYGGEAI